MPEMKTLNGYEVVDAKAREDIKGLQEAIENIDVPEADLTSYALKSELPTKVSQLQNDSKFITLAEVPKTDLSEYAKKSDIPDVSDFITSIPSEYITETELTAKGYATEKYVDDAIAGIEIPEGGGGSDVTEVFCLNVTKNSKLDVSSKADNDQIAVITTVLEHPDACVYLKTSTTKYEPATITRAGNGLSVTFTTPLTLTATSGLCMSYDYLCTLVDEEWQITRTQKVRTYVPLSSKAAVSIDNYATTAYVDNAVLNAGAGGGGSTVLELGENMQEFDSSHAIYKFADRVIETNGAASVTLLTPLGHYVPAVIIDLFNDQVTGYRMFTLHPVTTSWNNLNGQFGPSYTFEHLPFGEADVWRCHYNGTSYMSYCSLEELAYQVGPLRLEAFLHFESDTSVPFEEAEFGYSLMEVLNSGRTPNLVLKLNDPYQPDTICYSSQCNVSYDPINNIYTFIGAYIDTLNTVRSIALKVNLNGLTVSYETLEPLSNAVRSLQARVTALEAAIS